MPRYITNTRKLKIKKKILKTVGELWHLTYRDIHNNLAGSPENYAEYKMTIPKSYILYDSIFITFLS